MASIPPVKITDSYLTYDSIGDAEPNITYYNPTNKTVDAITITILSWDNYGDGKEAFYGLDQSGADPHTSTTAKWTMYLQDNVTKIKCFVSKVHFTDGTEWSIPYDNDGYSHKF